MERVLGRSETTRSKLDVLEGLSIWHELGLDGKVLRGTLGGGALHTSRAYTAAKSRVVI